MLLTANLGTGHNLVSAYTHNLATSRALAAFMAGEWLVYSVETLY